MTKIRIHKFKDTKYHFVDVKLNQSKGFDVQNQLASIGMDPKTIVLVQEGKRLQASDIVSSGKDIIALAPLDEHHENYISSEQYKALKDKRKERYVVKEPSVQVPGVQAGGGVVTQEALNQALQQFMPRPPPVQSQPPQQRRRRQRPSPSFAVLSQVLDSNSLGALEGMGFHRDAAIKALWIFQGNTQRAADWLINFSGSEELFSPLTPEQFMNGARHFGDPEIISCIKNGKCTYTVTKDTFAIQKIFVCKTCKLDETKAICEVCASKCHHGHEVEEVSGRNQLFFCDCGVNGPNTCQSL